MKMMDFGHAADATAYAMLQRKKQKIGTKAIVLALRYCSGHPCSASCPWYGHQPHSKSSLARAAANRLELLERKLCDWCGTCPKGRENPDDCEILWPEEGRREAEP